MKRGLLIVTGLVAAAVAGGADFLTDPATAQVISGGGGAGASVASGAYWYAQYYPNAALTGTTSETAMFDVTVPANAMGPLGVLRITTAWTMTNDANNKQLRARLSTTANSILGSMVQNVGSTSAAVAQVQSLTRNTNATGSQLTHAVGQLNPYIAVPAALTSASVDTTQVTHITLTGTLAVGTDTLTLLGVTVEALHP